MSSEAQNPSPIDSDAALIAALGTHSEKLRPGSLGDLARLWRSELANSPESVIQDVVKARLADARYAGFLADSTTAPAAPAAQPQSLPLVEAIKARMAASRGGAPGLNGTYGRGA